MSNTKPIVKNTLHVGKKYVPITNGCRVYFHFQTWTIGEKRILIDDSREIGQKKPMELVIGHKFKLEVWESIVKLMSVGEVASFQVKKELVINYPLISKTIRDLGQKEKKVKHMCAMTLHKEGLGYPDLDLLVNNPRDLEFIMELIEVEKADEYEKDVWQMNIDEKLQRIPELKAKGNKLFEKKLYDEAEDAYYEAIAMCEQLMLCHRKTDEEWITINKIKIPILLNYVQCKLSKKDYYSVIEHCNTVLQYDPDNEKALYRRAKAHIGAWNPDLAEKDFKRLKTLNPSLTALIDKELENLKRLCIQKEESDKNAYKSMFSSGKI